MMGRGMATAIIAALAHSQQICVDFGTQRVETNDYPRSSTLYQHRDRGKRPVSAAQLKREAKKRKNLRKRKK